VVNSALSQIYGSGDITEIFGRWFGMFGNPGTVTRIKFLLGTIPENGAGAGAGSRSTSG
jgi:hypothetical protein